MGEEDPKLKSSTEPALAPIPAPIPVPVPPATALPLAPPIAPIPTATVLPVTPPIAPIPPPPPSAVAALILRHGTPTTDGSDSDREGSAPPPPSKTAAATAPDEYEISEESRLAKERQEKAVQDFLLKRKAYAMAVPTNDLAVRARLRRLGEPVTLFGEREMERRDRLRSLMARLDSEGQLDKILKAHEDEQAAAAAAPEDDDEGPQTYPFYTEGSEELLQARIDIAKYSLARAAARLERTRRRRDDPDEDPEAEAEYALKQAAAFSLQCSEMGDERPLCGCSFSPDGSLLATW